MVADNTEPKVSVIAGIVLLLVGGSFYLFPWLIPMFYDMPKGTTLPYYGILAAIEMTTFARSMRERQSESVPDES